jgi:hypothetical protein
MSFIFSDNNKKKFAKYNLEYKILITVAITISKLEKLDIIRGISKELEVILI